ncbi:hypothetical protein GGI42DRAFT_323661 [Trichoderma sp. SZMC 28013]
MVQGRCWARPGGDRPVSSPCRALQRTGCRTNGKTTRASTSAGVQPHVSAVRGHAMQIRCTTCAFLCSCDEELAQTPLTRVEAVTTATLMPSSASVRGEN